MVRTSCKQQGAPVPQRWIAAGATVTRFDWKVTVLLVQASGADETIRQEGRRGGHSQTRFECDRDRFAPNLTTFTGVCPNALERIVRRVTLAIERTGRLRVSPDHQQRLTDDRREQNQRAYGSNRR